jgi:hypothetical protein
VLNEGTLVLEGVTLAQVVELVVKVLVDLAGGAVLDQQTTEDTETAHPHNLAVRIVSHNPSPTHLRVSKIPCILPLPCFNLLILHSSFPVKVVELT